MTIGGTLTSSSSSSTKIILDDLPSRRGTEIFPCVLRKTFHVKLLRLGSVRSRILKPIRLRSSSIKVTTLETEPEKAVRVRFQLRKECVFGEHFFILGDLPPVFGGLWDPQNALPLNWEDGHVWTIDLDLPVGRLVEFKFILKAQTGEILWQPGPNRSLQTWETNKTIRICEDWENADLQMMLVEDFVPLNQEEKQSLDMPIVAENDTHPKQSVTPLTSVSLNGEGEEVEFLATVQQISSVIALENEGYVSDDEPEESSNGALTARDQNVTEEEAMFTEDESPVLVPGLFPPSDLDSEEVSGPIIAHVAAEEIHQGKTETFPKVDKKQETKGERKDKGKVKAVSLFEKSEQEAVEDVETKHYNAAEEEVKQQLLEKEALETPNVLLEKDIQWGRRKLYNLLSNFGLF